MSTLRAGSELPGGTYALGGQRHADLMRAMGSTAPADGSAHPVAGWLIAFGGMGVTIGELFEAVGVPMEDGPMLGGCKLELHRPLGIETAYAVTARIATIEEKTGRKLGRFDVMTLKISCAEPGGEPAADCTARIVLPRKEA